MNVRANCVALLLRNGCRISADINEYKPCSRTPFSSEIDPSQDCRDVILKEVQLKGHVYVDVG